MDKKKILIIDDEIDFCHLMKLYFLNKDYEVAICTTLNEANVMLSSYDPHIILLDNNLPDGFGWDNAEDIAERNKNIQLYLISAYNEAKNFTSSYNNITILEKPISMDVLEEIF